MTTGARNVAAAVFLSTVVACAGSCATVPTDVAGHTENHPVAVARDIRYASDGPLDLSAKHLLDVYYPKDMVAPPGPGAQGAPVLIFIHGGDWRFGDKILHANLGRTFASRGIVTVLVNYGLAPFTKHPGQVRDVARAFAWVKKNIATWGGDPDDIFLSGHSAGGHLAALLALNDKYLKEAGCSPNDISGLIGISGLYRVDPSNPVFAGIFDNNEATIRDASPVMHVGDKQPPALVLYGDADILGLDALAIELVETLRQHRTPAKLVREANRTHDMTVLLVGAPDDPTTREILGFIREYSSHGK